MNWLLKIVEGPQKGVEVALIGGRRTSFGSGDACDVVIADVSLPAKAFDLDVTDTSVTLLTLGGEALALRPFEVRAFGTTAIAVGPADQPWEALVYPKPAEEKKAESERQEAAPEPAPAEGASAAEAPEADPGDRPRKRRGGCLGCGVILILLLVLLGLLWFLWPRVSERYPQAEAWRERSVAAMTGWWTHLTAKSVAQAVEEASTRLTLREIADQHGLKLSETNGVNKLTGNVKRRTERLAIRALALASDPHVAFDLTDDESLRNSANELFFVVTEGALKATAASNRVVTVTGYAPSRAHFERSVRALNADVPGIERLETAGVQVGGTPPPKEGEAEVAADEETVPAKAVRVAARRDYPIAGILMQPYPCVVMRNGLRLVEGAQVGAATIVRITADALILKDGGTEFEWRP